MRFVWIAVLLLLPVQAMSMFEPMTETKLGTIEERQKPAMFENWWLSLRWHDRNRYRYGPQEFFRMVPTPKCLIIGDHNGVLSCVHRKGGYRMWSIQLNKWTELHGKRHPLISGVVQDDEGYGFGVTQDGFVFKFGIHTGEVFWTHSLGKGVIAPPAMAKGALFVLTSTHELWKFDVSSQKIVWKYQDEVFQKVTLMGATQPVFHEGSQLVIVGVPNGGVVAVHAATGERAWERALMVKQSVEDVDATPMVLQDNKHILVSSLSGSEVLAIDSGTLVQSWSKGTPRGSLVIVHGGKYVVLQSDIGQLRRVDLDSGKIENEMDVPVQWGYPQAPVLLKDNFVVVVFSQGPAVAWNTETFRIAMLRERTSGFSAPPIVETQKGDGSPILYVYSNYGNMMRAEINLDWVRQKTMGTK